MKFDELQSYLTETLSRLFWPICTTHDMEFAFHMEKIPHNGVQLDVYTLIDDKSEPRGYRYKEIGYSMPVYAIAGKDSILKTLQKKLDSLQLVDEACNKAPGYSGALYVNMLNEH